MTWAVQSTLARPRNDLRSSRDGFFHVSSGGTGVRLLDRLPGPLGLPKVGATPCVISLWDVLGSLAAPEMHRRDVF